MCIYHPLRHLEMGKAELRWGTVVFLGLKLNTGEKIIATADGIIKIRTIKRKLEAEIWGALELSLVKSLSMETV